MVNINKQEVPIEESLKRKLELICEFSKTSPTFINGNIRRIDKTNLTYVEPNRIIINDKTFLIFNHSNEIFIENVKVNIKMLKKLKIKMYKIFTQFCIGSDTSESIFNLSFKRYEFPFIFITCE